MRIHKINLFLVGLAWSMCSALVAQSQANPSFLVKPYLQYSTKTGIYVLWETDQEASTMVEFGESRTHVSSPLLDKQAQLPGTRKMHEVFLAGLKPETNYFYRVKSINSSGDSVVSDIRTFKTTVKDSSAFMFALIGDTQRNRNTPWAWSKVAERVWQDRPNFVVLAGDLVDKGLQKKDWIEEFFPDGHVLMSRVPVFPVLGNHEQDAPFYYQYIVAPKPEYYYTFSYGNAQFFMLDSNRDLSEGSEQYNWLEWELSKSTATWKIAIHHHPPYSSDSDDHGATFRGEESELGNSSVRNLVPLYERYGLDFCLFGHIHLYERTWPLKNNMVQIDGGVVYINSGGAGGNLEEFAPTRSWFTQELENTHHYCTFSIYDKHLIFKAIDHTGRLFDTFQMEKKDKSNSVRALVQPPAVQITPEADLFEESTRVRMLAASDTLQIFYTLDGSEPTIQSTRYTAPLIVSMSCVLRARAYTSDGRASRMAAVTLTKTNPYPSTKVKPAMEGLRYAYYEGNWNQIPDFEKLQPVSQGISSSLGLEHIPHREDNFGVVFEGFIEVPQSGLYTLFINSDDGSKLYLNGTLLIDHDGDHSALSKTGQAMLQAGKHAIRITYFEKTGSQFLQAGIMDAALGAKPFSPFQLFHAKP